MPESRRQSGKTEYAGTGEHRHIQAVVFFFFFAEQIHRVLEVIIKSPQGTFTRKEKRGKSEWTLLPNNVLTPLFPNPNLMHFARRNVNPGPNGECLFSDFSVIQALVVLGVGDGHGSATDEMGGYVGVGMGRVVGIAVYKYC